jgi:geranylgeranyl diphosphate synthase type I
VAQSNRLVEMVQVRIDRFLDQRISIFPSISSELAPLTDFSRQFLSGGKRFRAQFCYWGWRCTTAPGSDPEDAGLNVTIGVASALELFHAAALVHDDIIDSSDTRRGAPSAHAKFAMLHRESGFKGSDSQFGESAAILLGDLLQSWSDELLDESLAALPERDRATATRARFNRMRTEVAAGQYLDILEENAWNTRSEADLLSSAQQVIVYKSAKYSIEAPLLIGASLGGASDGQLETLREFGLPLGIAYQLRDDLLGVFGDSAVTGKPSGDDLREGKRTVLVALALQQLPSSAKNTIDELLGDPGLGEDQIEMLQRTIRASGAVDQVERLIARNVDRANAALDEAPLDADAIDQLRTLTRSVTERVA